MRDAEPDVADPDFSRELRDVESSKRRLASAPLEEAVGGQTIGLSDQALVDSTEG